MASEDQLKREPVQDGKEGSGDEGEEPEPKLAAGAGQGFSGWLNWSCLSEDMQNTVRGLDGRAQGCLRRMVDELPITVPDWAGAALGRELRALEIGKHWESIVSKACKTAKYVFRPAISPATLENAELQAFAASLVFRPC